MSSIATRVDKATSELLMVPDWTLNMEICDSVNSEFSLAKDVTKAVKKRLQHKNPAVQLLALTLLETLIKNCGEYLHLQVVDRNILHEMIKIVKKKSDMQVRDKILVLLVSWQAAFGGPQGKYPQYFWAYDELRQSGVEFPKIAKDEVPIFTPPVTHPTSRGAEVSFGMPAHSSRRLDEAMASEGDLVSLSDFNAIQNVVDLLKDMLDAINLKDPEATKNEVIVDLVNQCESHQKKLMELVNSTADEELLAKALTLNDKIQTLLAKRDAIASGLPVDSSSPVSENGPTPASQRPLPPRQVTSDEEEEDDFTQLARRRTKGGPIDSTNASTETAESIGSTPLPDANASDAASSSIFTGPLALPAPPQPVRTSMSKEQDMIDLLSSNLSTAHLSPHAPQTPTPTSIAGGNHPNPTFISVAQSQFSPNGHIYSTSSTSMGQSHFFPDGGYGYPTSSPTVNQGQFSIDHRNTYPVSSSSQIYPAHQLQGPVNNYVTHWMQTPSSYPPPPWSAAPVPDPHSSSSPYSVPQPHSAPSFRPVPTFTSVPQPPGASSFMPVPASTSVPQPHGSSSFRNVQTSTVPMLQRHHSFNVRLPSPSGVAFQHSNSFNSRTTHLQHQTQINDEVNHSRMPSGQNPYVPTYRLFEDLVSLRNDRGSVNSGANLGGMSKSGQNMSGGRK